MKLDIQTIDRILQNANTQKALGLIAHTEGTDSRYGYNTIVGGKKFNDYSQHPNIVGLVTKDGPSTGAGRYQTVYSTWKEYASKYGLKDFSPRNQDRMAVILMNRRGALEHIIKGEFGQAINKLGNEWASLPSSTYNQHKASWAEVNKILGKDYRTADTKLRNASLPTPQPSPYVHSSSNYLKNVLDSNWLNPSNDLDVVMLSNLTNTNHTSTPSITAAATQPALSRGLSEIPQVAAFENPIVQKSVLPKFSPPQDISYDTPDVILQENNPYLGLAVPNV